MQCNLDIVTLNLVTTCNLVTILKRPFFNLVTVFAETISVTKSRVHFISKFLRTFNKIKNILRNGLHGNIFGKNPNISAKLVMVSVLFEVSY